MSDETSARLGLPLLQVGQAQKEATHNEALALLDIAVQPLVEAVGLNVPPDTPADGACWIIGTAPQGAWSGQAQALAGWSGGGWRFVAPCEGLDAWSRADGCAVRYVDGVWETGAVRATALLIGGQQVVGARRAAVAAPVGGTTIDAQARTAIAAIIAALQQHGLISG